MNPQSVAVSQTLSGERLTRSVTIPCTGNAELDLIAAFNTVCDEALKDGISQATVSRVLDYVQARAKSCEFSMRSEQWAYKQGTIQELPSFPTQQSKDPSEHSPQLSSPSWHPIPDGYISEMLAKALARPLR